MSADSNSLAGLGLTSADSVDAKIPGAYWPGNGDEGIMYEGTLGFWAGPSGAGKSTLLAKIAADWTRTRGHVIVMDAEDGGSHGGMSKLRLEAAGANLDKVHFAEFSIPRENGRLEAAITALGGTVLVIWDTADSWIEAPIQRWGKALHDLAYNVLPRTGATGVLVHHTLKHTKKGMDWRAAIGGATAGIVGKSRWGVIFGARPDDGSQRLIVPVKDSYRSVVENGAYHAIAVEFDEEDLDDGNGVLKPVAYMRIAEKGVAITNPVECVYLMGENSQRGPSPEKFAEASEWLQVILADGAMPVSDAVLCVSHPNGRTSKTDPTRKECGYMSYAKVGDNPCPYCGGNVQLVQGMKETAEMDSLSWGGAIRKALTAIGCVSDRKGSKTADSGLVFSWRLPDGHPSANETDPTYRSVLP
jgi:hypothetical protein